MVSLINNQTYQSDEILLWTTKHIAVKSSNITRTKWEFNSPKSLNPFLDINLQARYKHITIYSRRRGYKWNSILGKRNIKSYGAANTLQ